MFTEKLTLYIGRDPKSDLGEREWHSVAKGRGHSILILQQFQYGKEGFSRVHYKELTECVVVSIMD